VPEEGGDEIAAVAGAFNTMAADLERREAELRVADRTRRQLLADVSHELMTPLTSIRGYLETLRMPDVPIDAATRERYHAILDDETHRLERLIGDLLELSRLEAGGFPLAVGDTSVAELFSRVTERHEREATERGVTLMTAVGDAAGVVRGDASRLEQALQNLAANGLRHTPAGGTVTLESRRVHEGVALTVRDTGVGIAPDHLPHIFDRFYKADESRRGAAGGSGLGLSIVKAIVERHGGTIEARSVPGSGTVFEIRLPAAVSASPDR
jgi:signal transduction histidine kinase